MAYRLSCDKNPLLDLRDDELIVINPQVSLEVNKVGEASFTIYDTHPNFNKMHRLKSIFEVSDDVGVIFRGRTTDDTKDFSNGKAVDLEGLMAFFNDSIVRPYVFPDDFLTNEEYIAAAESGNVIKFFLKWLLDNHNSQVEEFQRFKLGVVNVFDPNNYLSRSNSAYESTWANLQSKLFDSELGGYLCIRYESDGNYIDYLSKFDETNTQEIVFGENLLDLTNETTAAETYSAIIPLGKVVNDDTGARLTIEELEDCDITEDIIKKGDTIYSRNAVANFGWICKAVEWDDVTEAENLQTKAVEQLTKDGIMFSNTIEARAVDLHFSDAEIESFRIYRNVVVRSKPHDLSETYQLTKLKIPLLDPKNTEIIVGKTKKTLLDVQYDEANSTLSQITQVKGTADAAVKQIKVLTQRVADAEGKVSEITQTAGQVYVVVENEEGKMSSIINPAEISIKKLDADGNIVSGFYYDADAGEFKFYGSGEFRSDDGYSYIRIEDDELVLYAVGGNDKARIGYIYDLDYYAYPYILLGSVKDGGTAGLVKYFSNGVWYGNSVPKDATGDFKGMAGASGMFVNTYEKKAYVVAGTEMQNIYTGEAVARFA